MDEEWLKMGFGDGLVVGLGEWFTWVDGELICIILVCHDLCCGSEMNPVGYKSLEDGVDRDDGESL